MIELPAYVPYLIAAAGILAGVLLHLAAVMWMQRQYFRERSAAAARSRGTCALCDQPACATRATHNDGIIRMVHLCEDHLREAAELDQLNGEH